MNAPHRRTLVFTICVPAACLALVLGLALHLPLLSASETVGKPANQRFAGTSSCRECHERFYQLWAPSYHGLAMQPYTPQFASEKLSPQPTPLVIADRTYLAQIAHDQGWILESTPNEKRKLPIKHVLGGKNVYYFLTPYEKGRLQTLPLAYDVQRREWFDTAASGVRHLPNTQDTPLHWTDSAYTFNTACFACHVSQLSTNYDAATDSYNTVWSEPGINCETCHGPCSEHVRVCREAPDGQPKDLEIIATTNFTTSQTNDLCATCHAKTTPLTTSYLPGAPFFDHFDLTTLEHFDYYPDGRDLGENYSFTSWRMSPCVRSGELDCMHCHTSSGRYRFSESEANNACLPCHATRVRHVSEHSHHAADSKASHCVSCHMPMTEFARMRRSDHSMLPPAPAATIAFGSPNACNICHIDKDASWANANVRKWHERDYQAPVIHRASLVASARDADWAKLPAMLAYLASSNKDEITAAGLIRLLRHCPNPELTSTLLKALKDSSPLVRARAAEALADRLSPQVVEALILATTDPVRLVRIRAAAALAPMPRQYVATEHRDQLAKASKEYEESLLVRNDHYLSYYNLGIYSADRGHYDAAITAYQKALSLQPDDIATYVNLALAHNVMGDNQQAERCLRRALQLDPLNPAANLNLALLLAEIQRSDEAIAAFRKTLELDSASAVSAYNLAILLAGKNSADAIDFARQACRINPDNPRYLFTLAFYQEQFASIDDAMKTLSALIEKHPDYAEAYNLLAQLHVKKGQTASAVDIYRQAAANDSLPQQTRIYFAAQAESLMANNH